MTITHDFTVLLRSTRNVFVAPSLLKKASRRLINEYYLHNLHMYAFHKIVIIEPQGPNN